ncbi:MAG: hypothetical protein WC612_04080 [Bdellovibrionales bacterium]|jgi:hypothetical protein
MSYFPQKKGTLLVPSGNKNHLHVIMTDSCAEHKHLLVNVSTIYPETYYDNACVIEIGEHPFIKHPSYVVYRQARIDRTEHLIKCVNGWVFRPSQPVSDALLERIFEGFFLSPHVSRLIKNYLRQTS